MNDSPVWGKRKGGRVYGSGKESDFREHSYAHYETSGREGYKLRLVDMVKKKLARGKTAEEIAQDLEESKETIQEIIDRI